MREQRVPGRVANPCDTMLHGLCTHASGCLRADGSTQLLLRDTALHVCVEARRTWFCLSVPSAATCACALTNGVGAKALTLAGDRRASSSRMAARCPGDGLQHPQAVPVIGHADGVMLQSGVAHASRCRWSVELPCVLAMARGAKKLTKDIWGSQELHSQRHSRSAWRHVVGRPRRDKNGGEGGGPLQNVCRKVREAFKARECTWVAKGVPSPRPK